jgi:ADP-ribosylglycohydrolase
VHDVLDMREMVRDEIVQLRESGHVVDDAAPSDAAISAASDAELEQHLAALAATRVAPGWPYAEPSELAAIEAAADFPAAVRHGLGEAALRDRILGAWLGRCAGCTLGRPVENWSRQAIRGYLEPAGAYPIADYLPVQEPPPSAHAAWLDSARGRIHGAPRDDDLDYTMLALDVLERHGRDFTSAAVAGRWLALLPFLQVYTAERAAYRNLVAGLTPPRTATHVNPYREWIGAQIRADAYGYVSPGDPAGAARMAFRDAAVSHTANGLYGAMWAAALIAAAFVERTMDAALRVALAVVPGRSRLAEALSGVLELHAGGLDWERARDVLEQRHGALGPVHTINNAAVVSAALLWGEGDFTRTIGLAVQGGWDTDCNGATAGSAFGAMHGAAAIPRHWLAPLGDRIRSALFGFDGVRVSELAERTYRVGSNARPGR